MEKEARKEHKLSEKSWVHSDAYHYILIAGLAIVLVLSGANAYSLFKVKKVTDDLAPLLTGAQPSAPSAAQQPTVDDNQKFDVSASDAAGTLGENKATVLVVEFSDFQCPFCSRFFQQTEAQLITDYVKTGKVKFVYKDFPLDSIHPQARPAAEAARCAGEQGKFWEYHDYIFNNQARLSTQGIKDFAKELKLDETKFNSCVDARKYKDDVETNFQEGIKLGVQGTPTTFINGKKIVGAQPYSVIKAAIDAELK